MAVAERELGSQIPHKRIDLNTELILGALAMNQFYTFIGDYLRSLPAWVDDAQRDFGLDLYERMLNDPTLASSINAIKVAILSKGPRFVNRVDSPSAVNPDPVQQAKHAKGDEIRAWVEHVFDNLQQPLEEILWDMLDFLSGGYQLAEQVYEPDGGQLILKRLAVKPRRCYGFVVDKFLHLYGLVKALPGSTMPVLQTVVDPAAVVPREKFWLLSMAPKYGDPRGTSLLRAAYNAWYLKQQTWPEYLKFLHTFATPSIVVYAPEDGAAYIELADSQGNAVTDDDGNRIQITVEEAILKKIIAFANGTAVVLPHGASHELIQSQGDGAAYIKAIELYDRQMSRAVLISARAIMEAEHGSKADTESAQDVSTLFAEFIARQVEMSFYRDVIKPLVVYNYGEAVAEEMCPYLSLTSGGVRDVPAWLNAVANAARSQPGFIDPSQYPGIDEIAGLPPRDFANQLETMQQQEQRNQDRLAMLQGVLPQLQPQGLTPEEQAAMQ